MRLAIFAAVTAATAAAVTSAPATLRAEEGERAVSVAAGGIFHRLDTEDEMDPVDWGFGGALSGIYEHGISPSLWLRGGLLGATSDLGGQRLHSGTLTLGVTYRWDVLKWVPQVSGSVGGMLAGGDAATRTFTPTVELELVVDRLTSRSRSWGLWLGYRQYLTDADLAFWAGIRSTWRWGYF